MSVDVAVISTRLLMKLKTTKQACAAAEAVNCARMIAMESEGVLHELEMACWKRADELKRVSAERRGRAKEGV